MQQENLQTTVITKNSTFINGDCVEEAAKLPGSSVDFIIFSPPFKDLFTYSDDYRDMGNCEDDADFDMHFSFLMPELYRILHDGRNMAVHCMDLPIQKGKDGFIGLKDFSGTIIKIAQQFGFIYHSRITIWKNPVTEMQRTKALGLLHKQVKKDSTMSRVGIPDYILIFRKDGERSKPVQCKINVGTWQQYASPVWQFNDWKMDAEMLLPLLDEERYMQLPASIRNKVNSPVWMDINYSNTLNLSGARDQADEKHICPLQLDTIERLITLYTNEGDTVFTPFGGIGSEGFQAVTMKRKAILIELKKSYFNIGCQNMKIAETKANETNLFS